MVAPLLVLLLAGHQGALALYPTTNCDGSTVVQGRPLLGTGTAVDPVGVATAVLGNLLPSLVTLNGATIIGQAVQSAAVEFCECGAPSPPAAAARPRSPRPPAWRSS